MLSAVKNTVILNCYEAVSLAPRSPVKTAAIIPKSLLLGDQPKQGCIYSTSGLLTEFNPLLE